ncbi:uncharacterized protein LOC129729863 isoform X2 [Wyeomyia smithii]|uniref:uncharacterized protein LOC129729863 isoform X2 n=1 Tax=Wyeomyia smithii TaxID=174621 RepID=UPI002467C215|nr:uncharacterized protein LOC129729863 isoform X2 [Wyeomyia smithii]
MLGFGFNVQRAIEIWRYPETEPAVPETLHQQHENELQNEWSQLAESHPATKQLHLDKVENAKTVLPDASTSIREEHYHYEISPRLENEQNDTLYSFYNKSIGHSGGIFRPMKHQNNNVGQHQDDYEYKFANNRPTMGAGIAMAEIDDTEDARIMNDALESGLSSDESKKGTDSSIIIPPGKQRRKLLFAEDNSIVSGFSEAGGTEPDYDDNKKHRSVRSALRMKGRRDSHRHSIDDRLGDTGAGGDDYYQQFDGVEGSYGDISDASPIVAESNRAHYGRNRRGFDGRNKDKTVYRSRKSAKADDPSDSDGADTTTTATVYHQHYDDSQGVDEGTCNCTLICAKQKTATDEKSDAYEESTTSADETTKDELEEGGGEGEAGEKEDDKKEEGTDEDEEEEEMHTEDEYVDEPESAGGNGTGQRELYIDLTIGIRNLGNASLSEDEEPMEFHKKIIVKREKPGNQKTIRAGNKKQSSATTTIPTELVEAIYQLVDNNDSLRTHVAPRLPDRSKLLSKLEQENRRSSTSSFGQKINDRHRRPNGGPGTVNRIEDNTANGKTIADVMEAIGQLMRQRD